jgi:hypothetical protein
VRYCRKFALILLALISAGFSPVVAVEEVSLLVQKTGGDYFDAANRLALGPALEIPQSATPQEKLVFYAISARATQPYLIPWLATECERSVLAFKMSEEQTNAWKEEDLVRAFGESPIGAAYRMVDAAGSWYFYYSLSVDTSVNRAIMAMHYPEIVNPDENKDGSILHRETWVASLEALVHEPFKDHINELVESESARDHCRGMWLRLTSNYLRSHPGRQDDDLRLLACALLPAVIDSKSRPPIVSGIALETYAQLAIKAESVMEMIDRYSRDSDVRMVIASLCATAVLLKREDRAAIESRAHAAFVRADQHPNGLVRDCIIRIRINLGPRVPAAP